MSVTLHSRLIRIVLALYLIATWSTMAGMEIFGWLGFALVLGFVLRKPENEPLRASDFDPVLPWKSLIALMAVTVLGFVFNGTDTADPVFGIGSQRWVFLLTSLSFALALWPPTLKGYRFFLVFSSIVAVYAVFQSVTGIDLTRLGSNRAVWPLDLEANVKLWRSAGFFGSPLQYGYNVGMLACLPLAMALLTFSKRKTAGWLFTGSAITFSLMALSLVTTFTRGAWIAMVLAWVFIAWLCARRLALALVGSGAAVGVLLFSTVDIFRARVLSLFDSNYQSNSDRLLLWKAHFEMFKDYPVLGTGNQMNEVRSGEYLAKIGYPDGFTGHAHNNYLQMLAGTGLTGFVAWMFIIGFMLWLTWRLWKSLPEDLLWPRALTLGALGAQVLLHVGGLTECNFKTATTNHNLMVIYALVASMSVLKAKGLLPTKYSSSPTQIRAGWANALMTMHTNQDDRLVDSSADQSKRADEHWEWK